MATGVDKQKPSGEEVENNPGSGRHSPDHHVSGGGWEHVGHIWGVARADETEREGEKQMRKEEKGEKKGA